MGRATRIDDRGLLLRAELAVQREGSELGGVELLGEKLGATDGRHEGQDVPLGGLRERAAHPGGDEGLDGTGLAGATIAAAVGDGVRRGGVVDIQRVCYLRKKKRCRVI